MPDTVLRMFLLFTALRKKKKNHYSLLILLCAKHCVKCYRCISSLRTMTVRGKHYAYLIKEETEERDDVTSSGAWSRTCHSGIYPAAPETRAGWQPVPTALDYAIRPKVLSYVVQTWLWEDGWEARDIHAKLDIATLHLTFRALGQQKVTSPSLSQPVHVGKEAKRSSALEGLPVQRII